MMRLENIADIYNSNSQVKIQTVDLAKVINGLWSLANNSACEFSFTADETNLTGNQSYRTMEENKIKWLTVDDAFNAGDSTMEDTLSALQLQPQRIRVFKVVYTNGEC